jgi:methylglyoxal/glyoxal reductase
MMDLGRHKRLLNGVEMPRIGYGVWKIEDLNEVDRCVRDAIEVGYRHIDTAVAYHNEEGVGRGVKHSGIKREDIFVTSKISSGEQPPGNGNEMDIVRESLRKLNMEYIDLYLIHWPLKSYYKNTWRTLIEAKKVGLLHAIGVSNCTAEKINILVEETGIVPMVNQLEIHPEYVSREIVDFCFRRGIAVTAYCPLMQGRLDKPALLELAKKYSKTPAQVVLRWHLQRDIIAIPKTTSIERMKENIDIFGFELEEQDMERINRLDIGKKYLP